MRPFTPYEMVYALEKRNKPNPPLPRPTGLETYYERTVRHTKGTLLDADKSDDPSRSGFFVQNSKLFYAPPQKPAPTLPSWQEHPPFLPEPTGNPYEDARKEYELIKALNAAGNAKAREDFLTAQLEMRPNLNDEEEYLLTLPDFTAKERLGILYRPDMATAIGILDDYWPRWFGRKAETYAAYNPEIYWIPWSFFMGDNYINGIKEDLVANLFNEKAREELWKVLARKNKIDDQINEFNLALEHPLMWNDLAMQQRATKFGKFDHWNTRFWALGNFSIYALPEGIVIPLAGGGHRICVSDVRLYIHDTFNFEGPAFLGVWDFKNKTFPSLSMRIRNINNDILNKFREKHGYGKDFTVLSPLHKLPDFESVCWSVLK